MSDYEFDSWIKNKYENVFSKNNKNMDLNMLSNLTNNNQKLQSINPFEKINEVEVEAQKKQNNMLSNYEINQYDKQRQDNIDLGQNRNIINDNNYKDMCENTRKYPNLHQNSPDNRESHYNFPVSPQDNKNQISYNNMSTKDKLISQKILE